MDITRLMRKIATLTILIHIGFINAERILILIPPFLSQCKIAAPVGKELVSRGHEVFAYLPIQLDADICYKGTGVTVLAFDMGKDNWDLWLDASNHPSASRFGDFIKANCRGMFVGKEHDIDKLSKYNFDIVVLNIINRLSRCHGIIPHKFGIPYISLGSGQFPREMGRPFLPNIEPLSLTTFSSQMTFEQRLITTVLELGLLVIDPLYFNQPIEKEILPQGVTYADIIGGAEMFITDKSLFLNDPIPYTPNILSLGGFSMEDPEKLTSDLEKFVMGRPWKCLILVSFGSIIRDDFKTTTAAIENVASQLSEFGFIWKSSSNSLKGNILRTKWIPQNDILGHNKTKLFISHCGSGSWYEALYHAVPLVCIPCIGDQYYSAAVTERRGWGLTIDEAVVTSGVLENLVTTVLTNESFLKNIQRDSAIYRDIYREPARKVAARAIEHVIKFGGEHFRPATYKLSFISLTMLDVWSVILGFILVILWVTFTCLKKLFSKIKLPFFKSE